MSAWNRSKMRLIVVMLFFGAAMLGVYGAEGQQIPELGDVYGGMTSADILGEPKVVDGLERQSGEEGWTFKFAPGYISADSASLAGGTLQGGIKKLQLDVRFLQLSPDEGDSLGQVRGRLKYKFHATDSDFAITFVGSFTDLEDVYDQLDVGLAFSQEINAKFTLTGNAIWRDKSFDSGDSVSDVVGIVGFESSLSKSVLLAADYTLENDTSNADDYSAVLLFFLSEKVTLFLGGGKGDVYFTSLSIKLPKRS